MIDDHVKLHRFAKALSSMTRIQILNIIHKHGEISLIEIAKITGLPLPVVSKHVKILEENGLVVSGLRNGRKGLAKVVKPRYRSVIIKI